MPQSEHFDVLVLGSGQGGQLIAWHLAQAGRRVALVERRWVGGSCPNIACMPSKTEPWSARVAHLARQGQPLGADAWAGAMTECDYGTVPRPPTRSPRRRAQGAIAAQPGRVVLRCSC